MNCLVHCINNLADGEQKKFDIKNEKEIKKYLKYNS